MEPFAYLLVLLGCLLGTAPLELVLGTRVYARWRRLLLTLLPVLAVFLLWDVLAIRAGHWSYDTEQVTGITLGVLPLGESAQTAAVLDAAFASAAGGSAPSPVRT